MLITDSQKSPDIPRNRLLIELQEKVKNIQLLSLIIVTNSMYLSICDIILSILGAFI